MKLLSMMALLHQENEEPIKNIIQITGNWLFERRKQNKRSHLYWLKGTTTRELYKLQRLNQIYSQESSIWEKIKTSNTHFIESMPQIKSHVPAGKK